MKIFYNVVGKKVELFSNASSKPFAVLDLDNTQGGLYAALERVSFPQDRSDVEKSNKSIFNSKGNPRLVGLYGGYWTLKLDVPVHMKADRFKLEADVTYLALRLCLHYNLPEHGVTYHIIKHAIRNMYYTKFGGRV